MSLKFRLVLFSSLALMAIFALFTAYNYRQDILALERAEQEKVEFHLSAIQAELDKRFDLAWAAAQFVASDEEIRAAFAARDRTDLQNKLMPFYESVQDQMGQLHFHLPDGTSFLRMHQPDLYGDYLGDSRMSVIEANESRSMVESIEKGAGGLGCRVIMPLSFRGEHLGTVEMGAKIDQEFLLGLQDAYGSDYFIYGKDEPGRYTAATLGEDFFPIAGEQLTAVMEGNIIYNFADDGRNIIATLPLTDYRGEVVAYLKMVTNRSEVIAAMFDKQIYMALSYISVVFISAFLVMLTLNKSILGPLGEFKDYLKKVSNLDLSARLPVHRKDELGEMAENLNHTVEVIRMAMEDLETAHRQTLIVLDNISAVVYVADIDTHELLFMNKYGKDIYGDVVGRICWQALQKGQDTTCEFCEIQNIPYADLYARERVSWEVRSTYNHRHYEYRCGVIKWIDGRMAWIAIATDSTERKMAEEIILQSREWYRTLAEDIPALVCRISPDYKITFVNDAYCHLMGEKRVDILYKSIFDIIPPENQQKFNEAFEVLNPGQPVSTNINTRVSFDGRTRWIKWINRALYDQHGSIKEYLSIGEDITEQKLHEAQLEYLSLHDPLTGVYNKTYYYSEVNRLEGGREYPVAVIVADLDNLKMINDTYGHNVGDQALKDCAGILLNSIRLGDVVARVGGDEFVIIMQRTDSISAEGVICRINAGIDDYNQYSALPIGASLGLAVTGGPDKSVEDTYIEADRDMYRQKAKNGLDETFF